MSESEHPVELNQYLRRCALVFGAVLCSLALMIFASYLANVGWPAKVAIILTIAAGNASVVAGFLMHLLSEKKMIFTVLAFTVIFFIGLIGLTVWATNDFPPGTAMH